MPFDIHTVFAAVGFLLAAYSVVGNDAVQTLGTFIASSRRIIPWYYLWAGASLVMVTTIVYSWIAYDGDISYGRLEKIPYQPSQWYHVIAPLILVFLTRSGIPVSTTFLVLSTFASTVVLGEMLTKSVLGYVVAAVVAFVLWLVISRFVHEKRNTVKKGERLRWTVLQWLSTGFLWWSWLTHDMANIAVFLPRALPLWMLIGGLFILVAWLAYIFNTSGGKIQEILIEKTGTRFIRSASIIDFVYALILWFFKELNSIPMSTTWVFVGLLAGRELAIAHTYRLAYNPGYVFPLLRRDFAKMMLGLAVSIALAVGIHYIF